MELIEKASNSYITINTEVGMIQSDGHLSRLSDGIEFPIPLLQVSGDPWILSLKSDLYPLP